MTKQFRVLLRHNCLRAIRPAEAACRVPGPLLGGWLGEHVGLRASLMLGGAGAILLALAGWRATLVARQRNLPS